MGSFRITMLPEPPNDAEFLELFAAKSAPLPKQRSPSRVDVLEHLRDNAIDARLQSHIGFLRTHLLHYHGHPAGQEIWYPARKNALRRAVEVCDQIAALLEERLRKARWHETTDFFKGTHGRLVEGVLDTRMACDAKYNQLVQLEHYMSDQNLTDLAGAVQGKESPNGHALRQLSGDHLPEFFNPFHQYSMGEWIKQAKIFVNKSRGMEAFDTWKELMDNARSLGEPEPSPFPIYVEGFNRVSYGTDMETVARQVDYDGRGEDSRYHVRLVDESICKQYFRDGVWHTEVIPDLPTAAFVIDANESLFIFGHARGERHHSTPTGGAPVICAGKLVIARGKIKEMDDHSGHYSPTPRHMLTGMGILADKGVIMPEATVNLSNNPGMGTHRILPLLAWARRTWESDEASRQAFQATIAVSSDSVPLDDQMAMFGPDYESARYAEGEEARVQAMDMFFHNAPKMKKAKVTYLSRTRRNAMRPAQARELRPLQPVLPAAPAPTPAPEAPTPPTGRNRARGMAVRGNAPKF